MVDVQAMDCAVEWDVHRHKSATRPDPMLKTMMQRNPSRLHPVIYIEYIYQARPELTARLASIQS